MKAKVWIATWGLVALWAITGQAHDFENYIASTRLTNGLALGISVIGTGINTNTTEAPVDLLFKAPTNTHSMLFMPKDEYAVKMKLYDSDNHEVQKKELGLKYGYRFDNLYWDFKKFAKHPHEPVNVGSTWKTGESLPQVSELFAIPKSGTYRLRVEVQVMLLYLNTAEKQVRQIVRFPPLEIMLIRPENTNSPSVRQAGSPPR